jgi:hypothetical protein
MNQKNALLSEEAKRSNLITEIMHPSLIEVSNTYHSCFIAEVFRYSSEMPAVYQNDLATRNTTDITDGKPIAVVVTCQVST